MRVEQAARYLSLGTKAIRTMITEGRLPYVQLKPGNSPFLLDRYDLDKWIETNKTPATNY